MPSNSDSSHPNADICVWPAGAEACEGDPHGCFPCKLRLWNNDGRMQLSPAATPTKTKRFHPVGVPKGNNSWERPVVTDSRGMPLLKRDGELIRQKEYAERRTPIERARRAVANAPVPTHS